MKDNMEFRNRLIKLRKQKGWSQEELGYKLDVSRQTVSKWETGESTPEITKLMKMSKLYNLTMEELLEGKDLDKAVEVDVKVIENSDTEVIPKIESTEIKELPSFNMIEVKAETKKKSFIKRHFRKIIIVVAALLLIAYLGFSAYKFCILKEINDKFNEYKNVDNCYFERKEVVTNNETGTAYIINQRYWYKEGLLRIENIKTENGVTKKINEYIDLYKKEKYFVDEENSKIIKRKDESYYCIIEEGILEYAIGENYYKNNIDIVKVALNIFNNISIKDDKYVKETKEINKNTKKIYDIQKAYIKQTYILENIGEQKILYDIEIGIVKDEDVNIGNMDLFNYEIIE